MLQPTIITWIIVITGIIMYLPTFYIQIVMLKRPQDQKTKDLIMGKGSDWPDKTYFRFAYGSAWADLLIQYPLIPIGGIGALRGHLWGYVLLIVAAAIAVYISVVLWFMEHEELYKKVGPLAYFTFYWGIWVYWGAIVIIYGLIRINGVII